MVDSLNFAYKYYIITLIEKKDRDKRYMSNCRTISLINVDVKIGSKLIFKNLVLSTELKM